MPKFSIIVPIYNVEPYLRECIDSVLAQTYSDFELILVDDGSPDNCGMICDEYAGQDDRIHVIHKKNGGLSDARNAGLDKATGTYICFLDSDDSVTPDFLEKIVSRMDDGADLTVFELQNFYPDGRKEPGRKIDSRQYVMETETERLAFFQEILLPCRIGWAACTRAFRRDIIEKYGLRFVDNRKIFAEDLYFSLCYCAHVSRIACMDECLYNYRQREDSIMGVQIKKSNIGRINELGKAVLAYYQKFDTCKTLVDNFHVIHFQIIVGQFIYQLWASGMDPREFLRITRESVADWDFLESEICKALGQKRLSHQVGSVTYALELKIHAHFLLKGNYTKLRIQCKLIRIFRPLIDACGKAMNRIEEGN